MANASRDNNFVPTLLGVSSVDLATPVTVAVNPTTHRVLIDIAGIANLMQTDVITATDQQKVFGSTKTVGYTFSFSINGPNQTPTVDYTVSGTTATLTAASYPNGVPAGTQIVWVYSTS